MAASDLVTMGEAKAHLEIVGTAKDTTVAGLISGASKALATWCRNPLIHETIVERQAAGARRVGRSILGGSEFGGTSTVKRIRLYHYPVVSVTSIVDGAGNSVPSTDYYADLAFGVLEHGGTWPVPYAANGLVGDWIITYLAGRWASTDVVPDGVKLACNLLVADFLLRKAASIDSLNTGTLSVSFRSYEGAMPPEIASLMQEFRGNRI